MNLYKKGDVLALHSTYVVLVAGYVRAQVEAQAGLVFGATAPRIEAAHQSVSGHGGSIGVVPIVGYLTPGMGLEGFSTNVTQTRRDVRALTKAANVDSILLAVDSPGGNVQGIPELAEEIRQARAVKPVDAAVTGMAASAGYWLASQAGTITANHSSDIGSVGVYATHVGVHRALESEGVDIELISSTPEKVEGSGLVPLTDEARAHIQGQVDAIYNEFLADVAIGRLASVDTVARQFGRGRSMLAPDALEAGMIDHIGTLEDAVGRLAGPQRDAFAAEREGAILRARTL